MTSDQGPTWSASDVDETDCAAAAAEAKAASDVGDLDGPSWLEPDYAPPGASPTSAPVNAVTTGEVEALPHWSEPPTGQVPVVGVDDTGSSPRFRDAGDDWSDSDVGGARRRVSRRRRAPRRMAGREPPGPPTTTRRSWPRRAARRRSGTRAVVTSTPEARPRRVRAALGAPAPGRRRCRGRGREQRRRRVAVERARPAGGDPHRVHLRARRDHCVLARPDLDGVARRGGDRDLRLRALRHPAGEGPATGHAARGGGLRGRAARALEGTERHHGGRCGGRPGSVRGLVRARHGGVVRVVPLARSGRAVR